MKTVSIYYIIKTKIDEDNFLVNNTIHKKRKMFINSKSISYYTPLYESNKYGKIYMLDGTIFIVRADSYRYFLIDIKSQHMYINSQYKLDMITTIIKQYWELSIENLNHFKRTVNASDISSKYKLIHIQSSDSIIEQFTKELELPIPPPPPLAKHIDNSSNVFCSNCGSSFPKRGFLGLWGKRKCINTKCKNNI